MAIPKNQVTIQEADDDDGGGLYLAKRDPSTLSDDTSKKRATPEKRYCNVLTQDEMKNDVGKGKEKVVVKSNSDSGNDWMLEESDNDHSDYSNKSFDYLSVGEEKLIQLITGQSNRIKTRQTLIPDMIGFASEGEDSNLQDPFVGVEEREDIYLTNDERTHWRMKILKIKPQRPGLGHFGREAVKNGFSECFKSILVSMRNKPLLTMLEAVRVMVLKRLNTMRKISATWTNDICPSIKKRIDLMKNESRHQRVLKDSLSAKPQVEDYLKTYSSVRMDISFRLLDHLFRLRWESDSDFSTEYSDSDVRIRFRFRAS
ncbi:hypothetical protein Tco_0394500 [Tanacetum coccineum]